VAQLVIQIEKVGPAGFSGSQSLKIPNPKEVFKLVKNKMAAMEETASRIEEALTRNVVEKHRSTIIDFEISLTRIAKTTNTAKYIASCRAPTENNVEIRKPQLIMKNSVNSDLMRRPWIVPQAQSTYTQLVEIPAIAQPLGLMDAINQRPSGLNVTETATSALLEILVGERAITIMSKTPNTIALKNFMLRMLAMPFSLTKTCIIFWNGL